MSKTVFTKGGVSISEIMSPLANEVGAVNLGQGFAEALKPTEVVEAAIKALRDGPHQYPPGMLC